jgi:hypothetical protein
MGRIERYFVMPGLVPGIQSRHRTSVGASLDRRVKPRGDKKSSLGDSSVSL